MRWFLKTYSNSQRMDTDDALLLALLVLKKREIAKNAVAPRKHKVWARKLLTERKWKGEYHVFVKEMMSFDHETFYKQFRMSPSRYEPNDSSFTN